MKKTNIIVSLFSASILFAALTGCGSKINAKPDESFSFLPALSNGTASMKVGEKDVTVVTTETDGEGVTHGYKYSSSDETVLKLKGNKVTALKSGESVITVFETTNEVTRRFRVTVYGTEPYTGVAVLSNSYEQKTEIIGKLEKYAMDENLTGLPIFEDGGYVMYSDRVVKGTENYITGYGFGILGEGSLSRPLDAANEENAAWRNYYHSASSSDPQTINILDAEGSEVSDLGSYISTGYWGTKMNATKDGYDWYPSLAIEERPIPMEVSETGELVEKADKTATANYWKFHVRTGDDPTAPVKYDTLSTKTINGTQISSFKGRKVTLDDYLYAYKALLTKSFGLYRGAELAGDTKDGIIGAADYFNGTGSATTVDEDLFAKKVAITGGTDAEGAYLTVGFINTYNPFNAMYHLASSLYQPLCKDFIKVLGNGDEVEGMKNYGAFIENKGNPVDSVLSLGNYTLEQWETDKAIVFKRNADFYERKLPATAALASIEGVKITVYTGALNDNKLVFNEFLKGNVDSASIPTIDLIKQYSDDPRTTTVPGESVFKLNINSCTQEEWEEKFGTDGTVTVTQEEDYWDVKPWMSNDNFLKGLNLCIDRKTFAESVGRIPSNCYFSGNYMSNPEEGISYNSTDAHKDAMKDYSPSTFGYDKSAALVYFRHAVNELVAAGDLVLGTVENPTKITMECWWQAQSNIDVYGTEIAGYIQNTFNDEKVCGGKVTLEMINKAPADWEETYTKHLQIGQFDLGFGSISGNSLDPLNFMEVLKSDNSSGFTLNWGPDTSAVSTNLIYQDRPWSFDALWSAGNNFALVEAGAETSDFEVVECTLDKNEGGDFVIQLTASQLTTSEVTSGLYGLCIYGQYYFTASDYLYNELYIWSDGSIEFVGSVLGTVDWVSEGSSFVDHEDGTYTVTFSKKLVQQFIDEFAKAINFLDELNGLGLNYKANTFNYCGIDAYNFTIIPSVGIDDFYFYGTVLEFANAFPME